MTDATIPKPLTVGELRAYLAQFPDSMEVIERRYSDYQHMSLEDWKLINAVERPDKNWITRYHHTMSAEDQSRVKQYLIFEGN